MTPRPIFAALLVFGAVVAAASIAHAVSTCAFTVAGNTMTLEADCTTDQTIVVPDGMTLDGADYTITAVDPLNGSFAGAVVRNGGATAHVTRVTITAAGLKNVCSPAAPVDRRLRGILFQSASGAITHNEVIAINKGPSGCQEGNAIEVRNPPFDGTHPGPVAVEITHNIVDAYQKTGIVVNGDVVAGIHHNHVGESATQTNLAANAVQIGFGARGTVIHNTIAGNQWCGTSDYVATAVLVFTSDDSTVSKNNIVGNADVGIYGLGDRLVIDNNRVFDEGPDCNAFGYDYGIGDWGSENVVTNNKVRGYAVPYDPDTLTGKTAGHNKAIPHPHD
ncbi:MAG: right-handed parallel beta-helix repeat-containing protein [Candidatus Rokubacteria bacterium]|nr:right-handed parallel beta-helix repeat-containing protein [Candidatus Rokubacteria bacterium]